MNAKKKSRLFVIVVGALVLAFLVVGIVYAASITVDTFDEGDHAINLSVYSGKNTDSDTADHSSILGGERDAYLERVSGTTDYCYLRIDLFDSNRFAYTSGDGMSGKAIVTWDGNDGNATSLDPDGLGSTNLQSGGNDGFLVQVIADDLRADLTIKVYEYDPSTDWSYSTFRLPGQLNPGTRMDIFYPFSGFQAGGGSGGADFSDVGSIIMELDGTIDPSADVSVDLVEASSAREYGDLPLASPNYGTTILEANHIPKGLRLGRNCDAEGTYNNSTGADGDDTNQADDEDGVVPTNLPWCAGTNCGKLDVSHYGCASVSTCYINGWIDWDNDGSFDDTVGGASENIIAAQSASSDGTTNYTFNTPTSLSPGYYYARFRICKSSTACNSPTNSLTNVDDGEVEDYRWNIPTAITLDSFTATWQGSQVQVDWTTAQEVNTTGFNLWRSTSLNGSTVQVNAALIPAKSLGGMLGGAYSFTDASVSPGSTYYYKLEEVETGGVRNWYGPVSTGAGGGNSPTAVILSTFKAWGAAWWPAAALVGVAGLGLAATRLWRRRRA